MSSLRTPLARADGGSTSDRLLDAARACILAVGWRRTTVTEVARRAGVSRMTVYRAYADMPALFGDVMTREWAEVVAAAGDGAGDRRVVGGLLATVHALRRNALLQRVVEVDPELLLPYLLERRGRSQDAVLDLLADRVAEGQARDEVRAGDPVLLARTVVLAAHGWLLSAHTMTDDRVSAAALDDELVELVGRYLAP